MRFFKYIFKSALILIAFVFIYLNVSLYYSPNFKKEDGTKYNVDVYHQLQFLKSEMHNGAGVGMQQIFPEGFVFINALYGLSWCGLLENIETSSEIYREGIQEVNWAIEEIKSPNGTGYFEENLHLSYGAYYTGWLNYLIAHKLSIQKGNIDSIEAVNFKIKCFEIAEAINSSETPYLEAYSGMSWPADITSAIASLAIHDRLFEPKFQTTIASWIEKVKLKLDTNTQLIPHMTDYLTGESKQGARGSSQSLILNFFSEIDPVLGEEFFKIYKKKFITRRFGLPGVREHPKGIIGKGSIDSGPVILQIGGAASIVGQRAMGKYGDRTTYVGLRNCIQAFGVGYTSKKEKKYIFGQLPMADAFIAWSNSIENEKVIRSGLISWRIRFQLLSLLVFFFIGYVMFKR